MRLYERTRVAVEIRERACEIGAHGSRSEGYASEGRLYRGSLLPQEGRLERDESGMDARLRMRVLLPCDAVVQVGDAACIEGCVYRVLAVRHWSMHIELDCEAQL